MKLTMDFYQRDDVISIARDLLGKVLFTKIGDLTSGGTIVETEAYSWKEKGCHAFGGRKTNRNRVMFEKGGKSYVYLCYGMHSLFNVVTNKVGIAEAVLVRAIDPFFNVEIMESRRGKKFPNFQLTSGPGKLTKALGINLNFNDKDLTGEEIWIEDRGNKLNSEEIHSSKRIGIDYAGKDADLPWRFFVGDNRWVSR